jgi:tricorn protease
MYIDIDTKETVMVQESPEGEINSYNWSPDSRWITYPLPTKEEMTRIWVYNLDSKEKNPVTDGWYNSNDPTFDSKGDYLFFTSSRDFNPVYSWTEWNHAYRDMQKVYFVTLRKGVENPFKPENDEVGADGDENEKEKEGSNQTKEEKESTEMVNGKNVIEFDGIIDRIIGLPVEAGFYYSINCIDQSVYYCMGKTGQNGTKLKVYDLKKQKETEIGDFGGYLITADKKKMLLNARGKYAITDLPKAAVKPDQFIDLSEMKVWVNLKEEWNQIFNESWRQMRDFFYDPDMHGVDWQAIRIKYEPLVPYVNNRNDLNYIIGEMIGELNVGHAYVSGGDKPSPERIQTGLLGAQLSRDKSGYYKIDRILRGENWNQGQRSPLTDVGVDVKEGEYIVAVNGKPTNEMTDIYMALLDKAGKQVELTISAKASAEGGKDVLVVPVADESNLFYFNWVQNNIRKVNEATGGQVGYIHIPDMSAQGLNEFVKYYYPQIRKRGLIIDDRGNGGGNVSPMIIERLRRELALMRISRNGTPNTSPAGMHFGPKVMLLDNYSASDGDLFPYQFKILNMGKLIGVRSWGGVVGIRGSLPFIDGGELMKPEFASYARDGSEFVIEGHGVEPDVVVDNDPAMEYEGIDQQLNKAIEVILEELKNWPDGLPGIPEYPDKNE